MDESITDFNMDGEFECDMFVSLIDFPDRSDPGSVDGTAAKFSYKNGVAKLILSGASVGDIGFDVPLIPSGKERHLSGSYDGNVHLLYGLAWNRKKTYIAFDRWHVEGGLEFNHEPVRTEIRVDTFRILSSKVTDGNYISASASYEGLEKFIGYRPFSFQKGSVELINSGGTGDYQSNEYNIMFGNVSYQMQFRYDVIPVSKSLSISRVAKPIIRLAPNANVNGDQIDGVLRSIEDFLLILMDSKSLYRQMVIGDSALIQPSLSTENGKQNIFVGYQRQEYEEYTMGRQPSITFRDIESDFQPILSAWFGNRKLMNFVRPYLVLYKNKMTPEATFISMLSAIEIYYQDVKYVNLPRYIRKVGGGGGKQNPGRKSAGKHKGANAVQKTMLLIENLPSSVKRLLFGGDGQEVDQRHVSDFAKMLNKNRNHFVHGKNGQGVVKRDEYIVQILEVLVFICLIFTWKELGVDEKIISKYIERDFSEIVIRKERIEDLINPLNDEKQ
ncbi:hypothetical protein OZX65_01170 [Leuconostocaceae bacterium ESL0723]|nr:hypothetical protein OZX65_01170 [Leuconostocaceae bacterium ESL0723]